MDMNLVAPLKILYQIESARIEDCRKLCKVLSLRRMPVIEDILIQNEQNIGLLDISFLEQIGKTINDRDIQRNITDWPFENFWGNPYEPSHSKLLKFFIDPNEEHDCGCYLLKKLLEILIDALPGEQNFQVDEHCKVSQPNYIDLLIERHGDNGKYAIIIENKINWAPNQEKQLQTYVEAVMRRDLKPKQIYVFYLPLTSEKHPNSDDQDTLTKKFKVNYR
ncbi:MAG TPA: PD-(D/E)XK nuclease family protein, partial [Verrucomicrobiae bacterium]|nr:PD-(D/E)XK nuclease family protein [Verrucomicrobiae bacterium]